MNPAGYVSAYTKYPGSKYRVRPVIDLVDRLILSAIGTNASAGLVEPFAGLAAVSHNMIARGRVSSVILLDSNKDVVGINLALTDDDYFSGLVSLLAEMQDAYGALGGMEEKRSYYKAVRARFNSGGADWLARSAMMMFLLSCGYNGLWRVNSLGKNNVPFGSYPEPKVLRVRELSDARERFSDTDVSVFANDYTESLKIALRHEAPFFYIDPPYLGTHRSYTKKVFGDDDHIALSEFCMNLDGLGIPFALSNSDTDVVREIYAGFVFHEVSVHRSIAPSGKHRGRAGELLITNVT